MIFSIYKYKTVSADELLLPIKTEGMQKHTYFTDLQETGNSPVYLQHQSPTPAENR